MAAPLRGILSAKRSLPPSVAAETTKPAYRPTRIPWCPGPTSLAGLTHSSLGASRTSRRKTPRRRPGSGEWPDCVDESEVAFLEVTDTMRKVAASGTLDAVDWNAELGRGNVDIARLLEGQPGRPIALGEMQLPAMPVTNGLIDESTSSCMPVSRGAGHP